MTQSEILQELDKLNADPEVHGIIVQMPLDCEDPNIDSHLITNRVDPSKDVDGLTTINEGKLATGDVTTGKAKSIFAKVHDKSGELIDFRFCAMHCCWMHELDPKVWG